MCSPTGPAGVLSIELKAGQPVDEPKVALAAIIAAQLATLAMPMAAPPERQAAVSTEAPPAKVESKSAAL